MLPDVYYINTSSTVPTFLVAFFSSIENLSGLNELLNCLMSLMLPFALLPTIAFSSDHRYEYLFNPHFISCYEVTHLVWKEIL